MPIKVLEIIHYPRHGDEWDRELIREPDTAAIEGAICRLDRDEWPYLWLHARESVDGEMPEGALCVMGGRGEYSLSVWADGDEIHYLDPKRGGRADSDLGERPGVCIAGAELVWRSVVGTSDCTVICRDGDVGSDRAVGKVVIIEIARVRQIERGDAF